MEKDGFRREAPGDRLEQASLILADTFYSQAFFCCVQLETSTSVSPQRLRSSSLLRPLL